MSLFLIVTHQLTPRAVNAILGNTVVNADTAVYFLYQVITDAPGMLISFPDTDFPAPVNFARNGRRSLR